MPSSHHRLANGSEELEVVSLSRQHWIRDEVRNDSFDQQRKASHLPLQGLVAAVGSERATVEVTLDLQQHFAAVTVLTDRQTRSDLPADTKCSAR